MRGPDRPAPKSEIPSRNRALDTLRLILIVAVMVYHYTIRWMPPHYSENLYGYSKNYSEYYEIGAYGVHLFFLISGYFVAIAIDKYANAALFLYRRIHRIYPAFFICCSLTYLLSALMPANFRVGIWDYVLSLGFVAENVGARFVDGAYWSLAVEMKFYLFTCVLFLVFGQRYWIGLIVLGIGGALLGVVAPKVAKEILLAPYMPMFLAGVGLAYHAAFKRLDIALLLYVACAVLFAVHCNTFMLHGEPSRLVAVCVATAMVAIVVLVCTGIDISFGPTAYLGVISYEIYLLHQKLGVTIIGRLREGLGLGDIWAMILAAVAIIGLAVFIHEILQRWIQVPMSRLWTFGLKRAASRKELHAPAPPSRATVQG